MPLLWRLRSPYSGQSNECHLEEHSSVFNELQIIQIPAGLTLLSTTRYSDTVAAMKVARLIADALRDDGFTDDDPV